MTVGGSGGLATFVEFAAEPVGTAVGSVGTAAGSVGTSVGSIGFAASVGIAAFFSPCAYALLPGYIGYYASAAEGNGSPITGAFVRGGAAVIGAVAAFSLIAVVAVLAGDALRSSLPFLEIGVGIVLVLLGVVTLAGVDPGAHVPLPRRRTSVTGFGAFGAMYALAATGCVSPLVIAVAVHTLSLPPAAALTAFGALAGTFAALLLATTALVAVGRDAAVTRMAGYSRALTRIAGAVLVVAGAIQIGLVY